MLASVPISLPISLPIPEVSPEEPRHARRMRLMYLALIAITVPLGLASRSKSIPMPEVVRRYGGDVLSAVCIYFGARFVMHHRQRWMAMAAGFGVCVLIEVQQLYRGSWLLHLRNDTPLGILLGHGFLWSDIVCYAVGSLVGAALGWMAEAALSAGLLRIRGRTAPG